MKKSTRRYRALRTAVAAIIFIAAILLPCSLFLGACEFDLSIFTDGEWTKGQETHSTEVSSTKAVSTEASSAETLSTEATEAFSTEQSDTWVSSPPEQIITYEETKIPEEILPYETEYINDGEMYDDERITVREGRDGCRYGIYRITYTDGEKTDSERIGVEAEEPVSKRVMVGTKPAHSVEYEYINEAIPFGYVTEYSDELYSDESYVKTAGTDGVLRITIEITFYHGDEVQREETDKKITQATVNEVTVKGTKDRLITGSFAFPVPSQYANSSSVSSWFGSRNLAISPYHYGLDFAVPMGTEIYASDGGVVIMAYNWGDLAGTASDSYGTFVVIEHNGCRTYYAHMRSRTVSTGDVVHKGELIGYSGMSGTATGPHLHFEIRVAKNGIYTSQLNNAVDPKNYLKF